MLSIVVFHWKPLPNQHVTIPSQLHIKYTESHIETMFRMVANHTTVPFTPICITDATESLNLPASIKVLPLWNDFRRDGGCYTRLKVFSREMRDIIGPRFICMDLDMIIMKNIDHILSRTEDFVIYRQYRPYHRYNGSLFMMNAGARESVWEKFKENPEAAKAASARYAGTDQAWILQHLGLGEASWDWRDGIYDMRQDVIEAGRAKPPEDCAILTWAGPRDPSLKEWQERYPWVREYYF